MAGCGLPGGTVIGATDATASAPVESPIALSRLAATIYELMRIDRSAVPCADWPIASLSDEEPIGELVA